MLDNLSVMEPDFTPTAELMKNGGDLVVIRRKSFRSFGQWTNPAAHALAKKFNSRLVAPTLTGVILSPVLESTNG